jgi:hypothetical protein
MNYKSFHKFDFKYHFLSTFHRGLFWGVIVSWTAVISSICGAAVTKALVIDKNKVIVAHNYATVKNTQFLDSFKSSLKEEANSAIAPTNTSNNTSNLESPATEFSSVSIDNSMLFDRNVDNNVKETKITIQNTTNNPELADRVYSYLQERNFVHVAIADSLPSHLNQTIITTPSSNLEAANYLKSTLNLGTLDIVDEHSFDGYSKSEVIIHLGEDAHAFSTNHNFIN